jgi:hypothetical protein
MPSDHTPESIIFEEVFGESRTFTINRQNITKELVFRVTSDRFLNEAGTTTFPGMGRSLLLDDKVFQQNVLPIFIPEIPPALLFSYGENLAVLLYPSNIAGKQINWSTWEIRVTYDVSRDNGNGNGTTGPSAGEENSTKFTQLSFNTSVTTERIQKARVLACQKALNRPAAEVAPYTVGSQGLIGYSEDGIEGVEVYVRSFKFQITQYMPPTKLTYSYVRRLSRMTTGVNRFPFFGFAAGSVIFLGASGEGDLFQLVPVTLEFEVKNNFTFHTTLESVSSPEDVIVNLPDGKKQVITDQQYDMIREPEFPSTILDGKPIIYSGWNIVSYEYAPRIVTGTGRQIRTPSLRTIYRHYPSIDFAAFKL